MANPYLKSQPDDVDRVFPPKGQSEQDKVARIRFWIDHGNSQLALQGMGNLHWVCAGGHYFIEPR